MKEAVNIYYDEEGDYLEIRFGEPTESTYEKIGPDTFVRIDRKTKKVKGYAVYNVQKGTGASIDIQIPANILKFSKIINPLEVRLTADFLRKKIITE